MHICRPGSPKHFSHGSCNLAKGRARSLCLGSCEVALLLTYSLQQHALSSSTIELCVKYLLPWSKIETAISYSKHNLVAHQLALHMSVSIVLTIVVPVLGNRIVRHEPLQQVVKILDQALLIVVNVRRRRNMHWIHQTEALDDPAFTHEFLDLARYVEICPALRDFEP